MLTVTLVYTRTDSKNDKVLIFTIKYERNEDDIAKAYHAYRSGHVGSVRENITFSFQMNRLYYKRKILA